MSIGVVIILLLGIALVLMAVEVFIVPGFGVSGIFSAISVVVADVLIFHVYGGWAALGALAGFCLLTFLLVWWVGRSKTLDKMSLHSSIDSTNATCEQLSVKVGDRGVALTRLALIGNAEFSGKIVEVKSSGKFIEEGSGLVVTSVNEALIIVREDR